MVCVVGLDWEGEVVGVVMVRYMRRTQYIYPARHRKYWKAAFVRMRPSGAYSNIGALWSPVISVGGLYGGSYEGSDGGSHNTTIIVKSTFID